VQTSISLRWPFGNNQAKGRFGQAAASLSQSQIQLRDADRRIRANIVATRGVVERASRGLARAEEAQGHLRTVHEGTLERFRAGDVTLIDTLVTEEDLTQVQIQLAQAWLGYAGALARLRFEQGILVSYDSLEQAGESLRFDPAAFLTR
jgi:outer membrane protein TolC